MYCALNYSLLHWNWYCFVFSGLNLKNLSAKEGLDFGGFYAQQVQFNPGQSEAFWKLRIFDDGLYEKKEVFEIELEDPVLAVLEQPTVAEVTILDNEDGTKLEYSILNANLSFTVYPIYILPQYILQLYICNVSPYIG